MRKRSTCWQFWNSWNEIAMVACCASANMFTLQRYDLPGAASQRNPSFKFRIYLTAFVQIHRRTMIYQRCFPAGFDDPVMAQYVSKPSAAALWFVNVAEASTKH